MSKRFQSGQSLMEILIGLGIISIMVGTSTYALVTVLRTSSTTEQNQAAGLIGNSLLESASTLAEANWNSIYNLQKTLSNHYYLVRSSTTTPTPVAGDESVLEQDVTNGLVGYWKFDEAGGSYAYDSSGNGNLGTLTNIPDLNSGLVGYWKFDEGSGASVTDFSGNNNTGTLVNSPTWTDSLNCRLGGCLGFNGLNQYVQVNNSPSLNPNNLTISVWAKSNTSTWNDYGFLVSKRNAYIIHPVQGTNSIGFYIYTTAWTSVSCSAANITNWNLYTLTWNGTTLSCYVNETMGYSNNPGGSINVSDGNNLTIGRDSTLSRYFNGFIDNVRIYNRALTATEVSRLYNMNGCKAGSCMVFNGTNNYISIPHNAVLTPTSALTVSVWVNPTSVSSALDILNKTWQYSGDLYWLRINAGGTIYWHIGTADTVAKAMNTTASIQANKWSHIVATYNGSKAYVYINGIKDANSITVSPSQNFGPSVYKLDIGVRLVYFSGLIDDVRIYNRELSASEISQIYNSQVYSRYFYVDNVNRDVCGSGNITTSAQSTCIGTSGVSEDPATQKITVGTYWNLKGVKQVLENYIYVTRWLNSAAAQNDWGGTSGVDTSVSSFGTDYYSASNISVTASGTIKVSGL